MIQLVVSDIDGTLLQDGANAIPPAIFEQIARLRGRGIRFCPASGRQYTSLRKLFAPVADQLYYLCENGAVVYGPGAPGPILSRTEMDRDLSLELCREILAQVEDCAGGAACTLTSEEEMAAAQEAGLPYGKYRAFLELQALDPSLTPEDVAGVTMQEDGVSRLLRLELDKGDASLVS